MALSEYLALSGELEAGFSYQVFLNGELVAEDVVTPENIAEHRELKVVDLIPGENEIRIIKEGEGQLYFATTLRYYGEKQSLEAARSLKGPLVQRQYEHPESGELLTSYHVGDLIRVRLTVELPEDKWYVIVEDPLPAGTEAVNGTLSTIGTGEAGSRYSWSHPDLRDEKAVFFPLICGKGSMSTLT
jgi:predicted RNA-binding protein